VKSANLLRILSGYSGVRLATALDQIGRWRIEIVKRCDAVEGFVVLPRRWVVERTFAWLNRNRRLAKDFEASLASALAWLFLVSVKLLARRLGRLRKLCKSPAAMIVV
jgi:transposase